MTSTTLITKDNVNEIIFEAEVRAHEAATEMYNRIGGDKGCCGFAWVEIRPARGILAKTLKETRKGDKGWNGGIHVWNPSGFGVQSLDVLQAGARAYAAVLSKYGVDAYPNSRLD